MIAVAFMLFPGRAVVIRLLDGLHGWYVRIHLARIRGDTAVGVIEQSCQGVTYASLYQLIKQRGVWQLGKSLGGTVSLSQ